MSLKQLLTCLVVTTTQLFACTEFIMEDAQGSIVNGRSMEFGIDLQSEVAYFPKGNSWQSILSNKQKGLRWKDQYKYLGITIFQSNMIVDGMNEKGLSLSTLWFPSAKYPKINQADPSKIIAFEDLSNWILGSFASIEEVKKALSSVEIEFSYIDQLKQVPTIHLAINDHTGKSIAVEFIDGKKHIFDNTIGVLTNDPSYPWHETNLSNYINLSAVNKKSVTFDGTVLSPTGQGSGLLGIPGDWTPPSRFVKIALMKNFVTKQPNSSLNANLAFHMLNTVDIPYGAIQSVNGKDFDYTQWIVVKDLSKLIMHYRTYHDLNIFQINLENINSDRITRFPLKGSAI